MLGVFDGDLTIMEQKACASLVLFILTHKTGIVLPQPIRAHRGLAFPPMACVRVEGALFINACRTGILQVMIGDEPKIAPNPSLLVLERETD